MNRIRGRWFMIATGAVAGIWLLQACAPTTRHRVLTFFFDGVPTDDEPPPETQPEWSATPHEEFAPPPVERIPTPEPFVPVSVHQPFQDRECRECHDARAGMQVNVQDARLCDRCHQEERISQGWSHGPINVGTCVPCHEAHESIHPHLLTSPVLELCMECHEEEINRQPAYHDVPNLADCTACHDPHRVNGLPLESSIDALNEREDEDVVPRDT